jgi:predicted RND superfamily exporter protein
LKRFIHILSEVVRRVPLAILIGAVALTLVFGAFTTQQQTAAGSEGFSPDSEEFLASQTVGEVFPESTVPVQVVFESESGDLLTSTGLRVYLRAVDAVFASRATELIGLDDPILGFFDPIIDELEDRGIDPGAATDAEIKDAYRALTGDPKELATAFLSVRTDPDAGTAPTGMMIVLLQAPEDDPNLELLQAIEIDMADGVRATAAAGISVEPFSFTLLFEDDDAFRNEIGRLFFAAGYIILIILASVFLLVPRRRKSVSIIAAGFVLTAAATALMVLEVIPTLAPAAVIGAVFIGWAVHHRKLRRSVADTLITLLVIMMSIVWMNGIGVLLGPGYLGFIGKFSEMLMIIPILLIGLGVDYAIHLTSRYREELAAGKDVVEASTAASRTVGVALVLATATTAVGFLTNLLNPVTAIADFGVLAAVGIGSAFLLMVTFVPAIRILLDRRAEARGEHPIEDDHQPDARLLLRFVGGLSVLARKFAAGAVALALVLGVLGGWGLSRLDTTFSLTDFVPEGSPLLDTFEVIDEDFDGGFETTNVLIEGDVATPDVHNALVDAFVAMMNTPDVRVRSGFPWADSPITVLYAMSAPPESGGIPSMYSPEFVDEAALLGWEPDFSISLAESGPSEDIDVGVLLEAVNIFKVGENVDVAALYDAAARYEPDLMKQVAVRADNGEYHYINVDIRTKAGEPGARQLAENLEADFAGVAAIEGVTAIPTNQNIIAAGVVDSLQSSQVSSLVLTLAAAMALLILNFLITARRPFLGVITILPVVLVVLWVFGAMALTGISFNPVTAMIAAIAIGIGVPYTIHITHRFQEDRIRCDTPEEAIEHTLTHTGGALAGSALTTVAGFGILITSTLKPFQQFGMVVGFAIGFALAAAVLVLPSMLVLWDRWHRRRGDAVMGGMDSVEEAAAGAE